MINKITFLVVFSFIFVLLSCNISKHYNTLTIFFDGVPNPDKQKQAQTDSSRLGVKQITGRKEAGLTENIKHGLSIHPDYLNKSCAKCHQAAQGSRLKQRQPELCYQCHTPFDNKFKKIHGPAAAGFCTVCHGAHKSQHKALLKMPARQVCQHCHESGDVAKNEAHKEISSVECLECHDPHGGQTSNLLKVNK